MELKILTIAVICLVIFSFFGASLSLCILKSLGYGCILEWQRLPLTKAGPWYWPLHLHWFQSSWPTRVMWLVLTHHPTVHICIWSHVNRVLTSVYGICAYNIKTSSAASSLFLDQAVHNSHHHMAHKRTGESTIYTAFQTPVHFQHPAPMLWKHSVPMPTHSSPMYTGHGGKYPRISGCQH